jgi:DNA polymerase-3 subunit delta'
VLEEPPPDTWLILTTSEPAALLPTIKSRLVQLRVGRLKPADISAYLTEVAGLPGAEAKRRADLAGGSIGAALDMQGGAEDERKAAERLLAAIKSPATRHTFALGVKPYGGRGDFTATLDAALELLRDDLARRLRGPESSDSGPPAARLAAQLREIERARKLAQGNVNPQLITEDLLKRLAEAS